MMLRRVEGPECPRCGCQDAEVVGRSARWGQVHERRQCSHCGRTWLTAVEEEPSAVSGQPSVTPAAEPEPAEDADQVVVYPAICCPQCGSKRTKVSSTRRPIRFHKCLECGWTFKSAEE